ncbi:hypothetical protein L7F22_062460 [Adiantum nelumboides]|nr:hypothetical protein [Adiantum nelumboides]
MLDEMEAQTKAIYKDIQATQDRQKHYANKERSEGTFKLGNKPLKVRLRPWKQPVQISQNYYFRLKDLWECFSEWSTVGLGVPITLPSKEHLTQYYVPYLSAIQLYSSGTKVVRCSFIIRLLVTVLSMAPIARNKFVNSGTNGMKVEVKACQRLRYEFMEDKQPGERIPLYFKVQKLADTDSHVLKSLCSNDLSSSSWMSIVWQPIHRIPACITIKDVGSTFLTYHSLSTAFFGKPFFLSLNTSVALEAFGVAAYQLKGHVWTSEDATQKLYGRLKASSQAWLDQLRVRHPDFEFYKARTPKLFIS